MLDIQPYSNIPRVVDAVQVTSENLSEVEKWCNGEIRTTLDEKGDFIKYIRVNVKRPRYPRQTQAFVGDWVLKSEKDSLKVYTPSGFVNSFVPAKVKDSSSD
jgi:hypothetical protein